MGATVIAAMTLTCLPAAGQTPITLNTELEMSPRKDGTGARPRGIELAGNLRFAGATVGSAIVVRGRILLPRGIAFNGKAYPSCSKRILDESGPKGCPPESLMGGGGDVNFADVVSPDRTVTFYNGGARRIWAYTVLYNPTLVKQPVGVVIKRLKSRRWDYALEFVVPPNLRIVAGIPMTAPTNFHFEVGGKLHARKFVTTAVRCPRKGFQPYRVETTLLDQNAVTSEVEDRGRIPCR